MTLSARARCTLKALGVLGLWVLWCASGLGQNSSAASPVSGTVCPAQIGGEPAHCSADLAAHQKLALRIAVPAGLVRDVTVVQSTGQVHLVLDEPPGSPPLVFGNFAGLHSAIHILLGAGAGPERSLTIDNFTARPSHVAVDIAAARPADAQTAREQDAEKSLANAEKLRQTKGSAPADVEAEYDRAIADWRALGDSAGEARALTWKAAYLQRNVGDPAKALPLIQQATALESFLSPAEAGNTWKVAGYAEAHMSRYDDARTALTHALSDYEKTGDVFNQEVLLENLSSFERIEGHKTEALQDAARAESLAESIQDVRGELGIAEQIGAIYITSGDLEQAYDTYSRAIALLQASPDAVMEGYVWSDMGVVYTELGDYPRAQDALDQAAAAWARNPDPYGQLNTLDDTGDLWLAEGRPDRARTFYERGLDLAGKPGFEHFRLFMLRGIGDSYLFQKDAANAEKSDQAALALAVKAKEGDSIAYLHCALGDAALLRKDAAAAGAAFELCRQEARTSQAPIMQIRAEGGLARVALQRGNLEEAESDCENALGGIEEQRGTLRSVDLRTSYFASMHSYYDLDIQILARLRREHPGENYDWRAFLVAERDRARTLLDQVADSGRTQVTGSASALRGQYDEVVRSLRLLEAEDHPRKRPTGRTAPCDRDSIARLRQEEHTLQAAVEAETKLDGAGSANAPLTVRAIQDALPQGRSALLEYWTGNDASYVWCISRSGVHMLRLPPAFVLDKEVSRFRQAILAEISWGPDVTAQQRALRIPAARRQTRLLAGRLARILVPPGLLPPRTSTLLVVADGPILSVPFAALPLSPAPASAPGNRLAILSEPSAAILSLLEARPLEPRPTRIAVFTNSVSSAAAGIRNTGLALEAPRDGSLAELPYASGEAAAIRAIFGASATRVFSGSAATAKAIRDLDWSPYSVGHFAMHAILNGHFAELSGLVTTPGASGPRNPQMLWYGDVCRLHAGLALVVLSACDTALGQNVPGEGLLGLTHAFFAAGSQRVLGTLWPVDDQATSEWMRQFYLALKATRSPAQAMVLAQRRMAANPEWSAPYYWAGFTLAGDWRPLP